MNKQAEQKEQRLRIYWYVALLAVPAFVLGILANHDPYENVRLNQVLELRKELGEKDVGAEVIAYLDKRGGRNVSAAELASLQQADGDDLYMMLLSAKESPVLKARLKAALADDYITQAEADGYFTLAQTELTSKAVLSRHGL